MTEILVNVDVSDIEVAERFYCAALMLTPGRRFGTTVWSFLVPVPFGHGYCLIEFSAAGYDAVATNERRSGSRIGTGS